MIIAPTTCYYVVRAEGETAQQIVAEVSPSVGLDIITAVLVSADYESDIQAVCHMDKSIGHLDKLSYGGLTRNEKFNPLYIPGDMELVDDLLAHDSKGETIRFVGMSANPFLFKTVEVMSGEDQVAIGKVEYRPFEIPGYSEIVESRKPSHLN